MLECEIDGKELTDWRAAQGHVRFSTGAHGEKGELPDGWRENIHEQTDDQTSEETPDDDADESGEETTEDRSRLRRLYDRLNRPVLEL